MTDGNPRTDLLDKAIDHFIANGIGDISLRALATRIGTSHRMLIYHFSSRDGLLTAVASQVWGSQLAAMEELAEVMPDNPTEGAWLYWTMLADRSAVAPLVLEMSSLAMHGAPWKQAFEDGSRQMVEHVAARLVAFGEDEERAVVMSQMCMTTMLGALWLLRLEGDRKLADATIRTFLDATWPDDRPS